MKTKLRIFLTTLWAVLACEPHVRGDLISDWNRTAGDYVAQNYPGFFQAWRALTMVHVAQFDAANAVLGGYVPYALNISAPGASPEAAAAQAAYSILTNLSLANVSVLNTALAQSLATIPNGTAKDDGIRIGRLAAEAISHLRANDNPGLSLPAPPTSTAPGGWRTTPPGFSAGFGSQGRYLTPWTMRSASHFRPGPPPALNSALYTGDYNEIRQLGSRSGTSRTPEQIESAQLQEKGEDYLSDILAKRPLPLLESARRHALVFMAGMDAQIQVFEANYAYNFWRPVTAIRSGDSDGNDATQGDASWTPFLDTHSHPDYPSALVQNTAAIMGILIALHGDNVSFSATSQNPTKTRTFAKLSDYVQDAITARVCGGTHFRNTCNVAAVAGRQIARNAVQNFLRPLPRVISGSQPRPGEFQLQLSTGPVLPYVIETSTNLAQWTPWQTNIYGTTLHTDPATGIAQRFYRAVLANP